MKAITTVIEWYGPYMLEDVRSTSKFDYDDGLYMVIGKRHYQRESHLQYVGMASSLCSQLNGDHHKIPEVTRDQVLWLGEYEVARRDFVASKDAFVLSPRRFNMTLTRARSRFVMLISDALLQYLPSDLDMARDAAHLQLFAEQYCSSIYDTMRRGH